VATSTANASHALLLLSDSALPLGSFAFSSGLESYMAHHRSQKAVSTSTSGSPTKTQIQHLNHFLALSLSSIAAFALPFILAAYDEPQNLSEWDDTIDASTLCTVGRRASIAQGKALLGVWDRAFKGVISTLNGIDDQAAIAASTLEAFGKQMKAPRSASTASGQDLFEYGPHAHFAPLWAVTALAMSLPREQTVYLFLFNHAKALLSAAVRLSIIGPYQAQAMLASDKVQTLIRDELGRNWNRTVEEAGQSVPMLEIWSGRHESLYSRIFNS
jgi:urease accessory protein